jgi:hypothetical protein
LTREGHDVTNGALKFAEKRASQEIRVGQDALRKALGGCRPHQVGNRLRADRPRLFIGTSAAGAATGDVTGAAGRPLNH